jgi:hypothetical protein
MPDKPTLRRARRDKRQERPRAPRPESSCARRCTTFAKAARARSAKQAIAIGLSKARRAGVDLPPPSPAALPAKTRPEVRRATTLADTELRRSRSTPRRKRASMQALKREGRAAASHKSPSRASIRPRGDARRLNVGGRKEGGAHTQARTH